MAVKLRIYVDTSVISAREDPRDPARQELTRSFWATLPAYDAYICPITLDELKSTTDRGRRKKLLELAGALTVLVWTEEMERLARAYIEDGAFGPAMVQDARHVAACTASAIPVLISWNYRHLVNRTRRIRVNLVNSARGYGQIEILAPPELL